MASSVSSLQCHSNPDEIKRHPEAQILLVSGDSHTELMRKALRWLMEGMNLRSLFRKQPLP
jgi:hypothetical protein